MRRVLIWDFSTRVLHLAFAGGITVALMLGFTVDDEHTIFSVHMLSGLFAGGALALRLVLGIRGPRHARFRDWPMEPRELGRFLRGLLPGGSATEHAGHNPLAAWAMLAMFAVAVGLGVTGLQGGEDPHEGLAWAMLAPIGAHLAGIATHSIRRRENLALAMVDGRNQAPSSAALVSPGWLRGAMVCASLVLWAGVLWRGFDARAGTLALPGLDTPLRISEGARHGGEHERHRGREQPRESRAVDGEHDND